MNTATEEAERIARERDFHNERFADDSQREDRVGHFYRSIHYGFVSYEQSVRERSRGGTLLEYGCGTGSLAFDLAGDAQRVIGIDISDVAIEHARRHAAQHGLRNVRFLQNNAEAMSLPAGQVDVVAGSGIVHHLDIPRAMREVRRVLRPGGAAIFAEPLGHNPVLNWYRNRTPELRTPDEHPLLIADLRAIGREFASLQVTYFGLIAPLLGLVSREVKAGSPLTRCVWWLDRALCRIPLVRRYAWYCILEVKT